MNPSKTALVLIEYQNEFASEGGVLHDGVKGVMADTGMLANSIATLNTARDAGVSIMHAPISFAPGYPEIPAQPYGILAGVRNSGAFVKDSWGAQIIDAMAPEPGDIVIEGKRGLDCFASTNIDFILRQHGMTHLAIAGFLTNCCVESTMRSAYERGYHVATLIDCCATIGEEEQRVAIAKDFPMFSLPMTGRDFLAQFG